MSAPLVEVVTVRHDGWQEVFEVGERPDGSFMVVRVTDEKHPIARIFPGPWVHQTAVAECFHIVSATLAEKAAEALTAALGGEA